MAFYPINLNVSGQLCVIIGGGAVATRKITSLLVCDAKVRVISPELSSGIKQFVDQNKLEWFPRAYMPGDLQGATLAFALTDHPEVQLQIATEAKERGIPINVGDNPEACTFQTAATIRQGDLLISVSTGGGSPALAAAIRKELESQYGPEYGDLVKLLSMIRQLTVGQSSSQEKQKLLLARIFKTNILALLRKKEWQLLHEKLVEILPREINVISLMEALKH
ncbi:MAG: bifunctional precorrin-2 dehydrogenase/sirohydrochlorin ferrochelatase [Proteobacteria bacterium]|jgi:precorrin-2 dehydrogenase/sirohydrochlorin ferrochelatase|nr:bifunctional precorrin-2 dehydrogenase/sirohydrochlorin ferrochelatase [Desulfocapsa sp.]MBU3946141.1 bifunctional precorrin-2 dehydrogenase/sirohydrochlorin ferrochelatase [Pseudomonadota bacterium]MCG2742376.1 bifunctional precorrin-2 dehydrogenase/sirohydrochlorin ferrochelatase [Desulfobacteraceae bacterium]MDO8947167.1 bifunctional precorrin-2 dehydrogenase/sirohydrochlorin ferrochelatase [Desulfocapsaceae bacterium]MBU3984209.1 bifunctional precorrin-2 dehydrogenase/sirohydrochlorin fe